MAEQTPPEDFLIKPTPLEKAIIWLKVLPWWIIALVALFIYAGIQIAGSDQRQDILATLLDDPTNFTENKFDVVYEVNREVFILREAVALKLADGRRITVDASDILSREQGTLICDKVQDEDCLDEFGILANFRIPPTEDSPIAGNFIQKGLLRPIANAVELANGQLLVVQDSQILSREEGILECDRVAKPDCEDKTGTIISFELPYTTGLGLVTRDDILILHDDGYQETVRPNRLLNYDPEKPVTETCLRSDNPYCETGQIQTAVFRERVIGTETGREEGEIIIRTVNEQSVFIPRERILSLETGTVSCNRSANPRCQDYEGMIIERDGETLSGRLTLETNRSVNLILEGQNTATEYNKSTIAEDVRVPPDCRTEEEGICQITIKLKDDVVAGRIQSEDDAGIVVQTVAPVVVKVPAEGAISTRRAPLTCAINNLRGCNAGIWLTLLVTIVSYSLALMIGLFVGLMKVSSNPILFHSSTFYVEVIRGTPLLVLLLFFAFVIGPALRDSDIGLIRDFYGLINRLEVQVLGQESFLAEAILGLAIGYGAFLAEVFRAGIESIGRGQMEAARSLGMSYPQAMRKVILPQAIRVVLPPLGNDFIAMLKDSALISVLALPDLLQVGRLYITRTFQPIPVYVIVALVYIFLTLILSMLVRYLEKRFRLP